MARAIVYGAFAVVALVLLITVGWVAALALAFVVGCAALCEWLLGRAHDTAHDTGHDITDTRGLFNRYYGDE